MTKMAIIAITDRTANSLNKPPPISHGPIVGHFEVPCANKPKAIGMANEKNRKITVQETTIVYTGVVPPASTNFEFLDRAAHQRCKL